MDIIWHGHSCFTLKGQDAKIISDPYSGLGISLPSFKADVVSYGDILAEKEGERLVVEDAKVLDWPGEFEVSGVDIEAFSAKEHAKEGGVQGAEVIIFVFMLDGIKICHLSGLSHELSDELLDHIGDIDVLLVPVGGNIVLDGRKAYSVVESIEPRVVIPMYFSDGSTNLEIKGCEEFLKVIGRTEMEAKEKVSLSKKSLPDGVMEFVKLIPQA